MFDLLSSSFKRLKLRRSSTKGPRFVAKDDLDAKHKRGVVKGDVEPVYSDMKHVQTNDNEKRGVKTVKVLMTKEEAMGLLSKRNCRGVFDFKDVVTELEQIPTTRVFSGLS